MVDGKGDGLMQLYYDNFVESSVVQESDLPNDYLNFRPTMSNWSRGPAKSHHLPMQLQLIEKSHDGKRIFLLF